VLSISSLFVRATPRTVDSTFDAQKTMGIIVVLLFCQGQLGDESYVPFWVVLTCRTAMGAGDAFRRLAHRTHDRVQDYPVDAGSGILRGNWRRDHPFCRYLVGHSGLDNTYHYWINRCGRCGPQSVCCSLEYGATSLLLVVTLPPAGLMAALFYKPCALVP
jgi:hypothetical protein